MLKAIILLVVGLLTMVVGMTMVKDSRKNNKEFQQSADKLKSYSLIDHSAIVDLYNGKCNSLSRYGYLTAIYGLLVISLAGYCLILNGKEANTWIVVGISMIGMALLIPGVFVKDINNPNPVSL